MFYQEILLPLLAEKGASTRSHHLILGSFLLPLVAFLNAFLETPLFKGMVPSLFLPQVIFKMTPHGFEFSTYDFQGLYLYQSFSSKLEVLF